MFELLPHVEDVNDVIAVVGIGDREDERLGEIDDRAHVERVVVRRRHVFRGRRGQFARPADLVERRAITRRRIVGRHIGILPRHPFHPNQRIAPNIGLDALRVGVGLGALRQDLRCHGGRQQGVRIISGAGRS